MPFNLFYEITEICTKDNYHYAAVVRYFLRTSISTT